MYIKIDSLNNTRDIVLRNLKNNGYNEEQFFCETEPYLDQLEEAIDFLKSYLDLNPNATITIVSDYDVDGVASAAIMYWGLKAFGYEVKVRLPRRFSEGYGLSEKIIDEINEGIIITTDNGIAAYNAIKKAKDKGLSVIVTDHHLPPTDKNEKMILPPADIILDPHVNPEKSEFVDYCGAAIAFRFIKELLPDMKLIELKVMASIATVADVMPLYGANRKLVKEGLEAFNKRKVLPGLLELMNKLGLDSHSDESVYGFKIGPIFNASGRLFDSGADKVFRLLKMNRNDPKLPFKANNLINTNDKRKEITRIDMERVLNHYQNERPIVIYDPEIGEGIIGLVAGRMTEDYYAPSIVFTKTEKEGVIKGSGRSIKEIHLKKVLDKIQDKIIGYGGHAGAAGLSIKLEDLEAFKEAFKEACGEIPPKPTDYYYDKELDISCLAEECEEDNKYAPYGEGNPRILYHLEYDVNPSNFSRIGDGSHFMIKDDIITLMGFGKADEYEEKGKPEHIDCVGYLSESWFNDEKSFKFEILSFNDN